MKPSTISNPTLFLSGNLLQGEGIEKTYRRLKDLSGVFQDTNSYAAMDPDTLVYEVSSFLPVPEGTPGGLYFGLTHIHPGKVGQEYFMTKGHFHALIDRAEYYWGIQGEGVLILMNENREVWAERMFPGSLHFIPGRVAHRVANTGQQLLSFGASWPADAGHDYEAIRQHGFARRLMEKNGIPELI
ncbi:MAG: glucose-6-phosphate isomerase family protein [Candidatus Pseudobacter hemicellulosilyticus]|uniref:glucose-6-phosphate isomerase n=1 Tax=Candidatus Pseudobacter hemicellulosilyticus TaxID=3121375 RepID=A0AAJ5WPS6_9BACT|nr:MAG: glucose-6-phosphate isomerase family protein [Pseudobacter sp.]